MLAPDAQNIPFDLHMQERILERQMSLYIYIINICADFLTFAVAYSGIQHTVLGKETESLKVIDHPAIPLRHCHLYAVSLPERFPAQIIQAKFHRPCKIRRRIIDHIKPYTLLFGKRSQNRRKHSLRGIVRDESFLKIINDGTVDLWPGIQQLA